MKTENDRIGGGEKMKIDSKNWLNAPENRQAFWQVEQIITIAEIAGNTASSSPLGTRSIDADSFELPALNEGSTGIARYLESTYADAFIVLHQGAIAYEWYVSGRSSIDKHLVFSVTKSIVGSLSGILVEQGSIDVEHVVSHYVPELKGSAFDDVRVRDLLDMTVDLEFEEAYLDADSIFARYRQSTGWSGGDSPVRSAGMHKFLATIPRGQKSHGSAFDYLSANSDVLGWVCEKAGKMPLPNLISELIWKPLNPQSDAYITVDRLGAPRAAGGFGCTLRDMARFGQCMLQGGRLNDRQIVPKKWIDDIVAGVNSATWNKGTMRDWIPDGGYRNQWWLTNNSNQSYFAAGIYGQWIYIDPVQEVVIAKQSSRPIGPATKAEMQHELSVLQKIADLTNLGAQSLQP